MRESRRSRLTSYALALVLSGVLATVWAVPAADTPDWRAILGPSQGERPGPQEAIVWREDITAALEEAKQTGRPIFAVLRCPPCKQCSAFDKQLLDGSPAMDPLLARFITVRILKATDLNLNLFQVDGFQDLDLSLWGYFLSPEGRIYSVFGGKDIQGDTTRISEASLVNQMKRVLDHHYDPRRAGWDVDGPAPDLTARPQTPKDLPGFVSWIKDRPKALTEGAQEYGGECLHCHMIADIKRQPAIDAGTFDAQRDVYTWPYPENVGLVVDRDDGLRVTGVTPDSAAAKAGLRVGDRLAMAAGRKLFSQTDFRGALHRGPQGDGAIAVAWLRGGEPQFGDLAVNEGWRVSNLDWRMSISQGNIGVGPTFFPLAASTAERQARGIVDGVMAVKPFLGRNPAGAAYDAGLRANDVIVAVNGESPDKSGRGWLVWLRMHHKPGETVVMRVVDNQGKSREVRYTLAKAGE